MFDPVHVKLCRYIYVEQVLQTELLFKAIDVLPYTFSFVLLNVGNMANQIESFMANQIESSRYLVLCCILHRIVLYCIYLHCALVILTSILYSICSSGYKFALFKLL